jgi:hypothetical protein
VVLVKTFFKHKWKLKVGLGFPPFFFFPLIEERPYTGWHFPLRTNCNKAAKE